MASTSNNSRSPSRRRKDKRREKRSRSRSRDKRKGGDKRKRFEKKEADSKWGHKLELVPEIPFAQQVQGIDLFETGAIQIGLDGIQSCQMASLQAPEQVLQNTQKSLFNKFFKEPPGE